MLTALKIGHGIYLKTCFLVTDLKSVFCSNAHPLPRSRYVVQINTITERKKNQPLNLYQMI